MFVCILEMDLNCEPLLDPWKPKEGEHIIKSLFEKLLRCIWDLQLYLEEQFVHKVETEWRTEIVIASNCSHQWQKLSLFHTLCGSGCVFQKKTAPLKIEMNKSHYGAEISAQKFLGKEESVNVLLSLLFFHICKWEFCWGCLKWIASEKWLCLCTGKRPL